MTRLRELRQKRGMSLIDLAFTARVHPSSLCGVERGRLAASARVRQAVCAFFEAQENELFGENGLAL